MSHTGHYDHSPLPPRPSQPHHGGIFAPKEARHVAALWNNLRALRMARGWTLHQAAHEMGVSYGSYAKLERGERHLNERTIARASAAFGVPVPDIFQRRTVPLVGMVEPQGMVRFVPQEVEASAFNGANEHSVALLVNDTLGAFVQGFILYFDFGLPTLWGAIDDRLCVCGLPGGTVLVRRVYASSPVGAEPRFHLVGANVHPIDTKLEWAAPVRALACPAAD